MNEPNNVSRALEVLTLSDVWELSPDGSMAPMRDGVIHSPFRDEKNPSFSVSNNLRSFKDFTTGDKRMGVWKFVMLCRPDWEKIDISKYLVEKAGLEWKEASDMKKLPKKSLHKVRQERLERQHKIEEDRIRNRRKILFVEEGAPLNAWPDFVHNHFYKHDVDEARMAGLAKKRGWPIDWVDNLVLDGSLRFPELPWSDKRFPAFTVQLHVDEKLDLPIGYHQRIWTEQKGIDWMFVPWRTKKVYNNFTQRLKDYSETVLAEGSLITPLPFVLGVPSKAPLWIITEGQWDAVTLFGLIGGFEERFDFSFAVFGLRGAGAGPSTFLSYYSKLIRHHKPRFWLFPDNDSASGDWEYKLQGSSRSDRESKNGRSFTRYAKPAEPTFTERLRAAIGVDVKIPVTRVPSSIGKDFNDYYKAKSPSRDEIFQEMERLQLC